MDDSTLNFVAAVIKSFAANDDGQIPTLTAAANQLKDLTGSDSLYESLTAIRSIRLNHEAKMVSLAQDHEADKSASVAGHTGRLRNALGVIFGAFNAALDGADGLSMINNSKVVGPASEILQGEATTQLRDCIDKIAAHRLELADAAAHREKVDDFTAALRALSA